MKYEIEDYVITKKRINTSNWNTNIVLTRVGFIHKIIRLSNWKGDRTGIRLKTLNTKDLGGWHMNKGFFNKYFRKATKKEIKLEEEKIVENEI